MLLPTHLPPPPCTHAQSCNPMDCSPPGSSVHGLIQAKILEWVAISFSTKSPFSDCIILWFKNPKPQDPPNYIFSPFQEILHVNDRTERNIWITILGVKEHLETTQSRNEAIMKGIWLKLEATFKIIGSEKPEQNSGLRSALNLQALTSCEGGGIGPERRCQLVKCCPLYPIPCYGSWNGCQGAEVCSQHHSSNSETIVSEEYLWNESQIRFFTSHVQMCRRIDVFELWCCRRLLRVPWTARRSNQSILKEISPEYS